LTHIQGKNPAFINLNILSLIRTERPVPMIYLQINVSGLRQG